ncbi:unnamed protein product [Gordionus sp. m RMFG-2023]
MKGKQDLPTAQISANGFVWIIGTFLLLILTPYLQQQNYILNLLWYLLLDVIIISILKGVFKRSRPNLTITEKEGMLLDVYF